MKLQVCGAGRILLILVLLGFLHRRGRGLLMGQVEIQRVHREALLGLLFLGGLLLGFLLQAGSLGLFAGGGQLLLGALGGLAKGDDAAHDFGEEITVDLFVLH